MKTSLGVVLSCALLSSGLVAGAATASSAAPAPAPETVARPSVSAPDNVLVGSRIAIRGKVKVKAKRRVVKVTEGSRLVARTKTGRRGTFKAAFPAGLVATTRTFKVVAPKTRGLRAWSRTVQVTVHAAAPAATTTVTSNWAAPSVTVPLGQSIAVSGTVGGSEPAGRSVLVQQYLGNAWVDRVFAVSAADGSYATALPASWLFSAPARVVVKASISSPEAAAPEITATVTPTWTPGGASTSWVPVAAGQRIRINPCETVEYRTNMAQAPAFAREALADALTSVSQATGVTFVNLGDSTGVGRPEPGYSGNPADTDLLVSWVYDNQTTASQPTTNGAVAIHDALVNGTDAYGAVTLAKKTAVNMNAAYHAGWTRTLMTHVYRHELGHIIGLGHPEAQDQVMGAGEALSTNFPWGAGDLAGFRTVGLQAGCVAG